VEHLARIVFEEDAVAGYILQSRIDLSKIDVRAPRHDLLRSE
jgi:hypothetical protein